MNKYAYNMFYSIFTVRLSDSLRILISIRGSTRTIACTSYFMTMNKSNTFPMCMFKPFVMLGCQYFNNKKTTFGNRSYSIFSKKILCLVFRYKHGNSGENHYILLWDSEELVFLWVYQSNKVSLRMESKWKIKMTKKEQCTYKECTSLNLCLHTVFKIVVSWWLVLLCWFGILCFMIFFYFIPDVDRGFFSMEWKSLELQECCED